MVNDNSIPCTFSLPHYITSCFLIGTGLHLGDCKIAVIVSLFIRLISCWNTPQNARNIVSELQEIQHFLGGMPPDPSRRLEPSVLESVVSESYTQPISRKSEQICNRSVKTCCQQADIWMRSLALYLSVLTGPQRPVNRSVTSCCDRAAAMLFSTGLLRAVVTELQQCCFQQACRKLLTQSCSNAVFNNL